MLVRPLHVPRPVPACPDKFLPDRFRLGMKIWACASAKVIIVTIRATFEDGVSVRNLLRVISIAALRDQKLACCVDFSIASPAICQS